MFKKYYVIAIIMWSCSIHIHFTTNIWRKVCLQNQIRKSNFGRRSLSLSHLECAWVFHVIMGRSCGMKFCQFSDPLPIQKNAFSRPPIQKIAFSRPPYTKITFSRHPLYNKMAFSEFPYTKKWHFRYPWPYTTKWHFRDPDTKIWNFETPLYNKMTFARPPKQYFSVLTPYTKMTKIWHPYTKKLTPYKKLQNLTPIYKKGHNLPSHITKCENLLKMAKIWSEMAKIVSPTHTKNGYNLTPYTMSTHVCPEQLSCKRAFSLV